MVATYSDHEYGLLIEDWAQDIGHLSTEDLDIGFKICRQQEGRKFPPLCNEIVAAVKNYHKNRPLTNEEIQKKCDDDADRVKQERICSQAAFERRAIDYGYDPKKWQGVTQVGEEWLKRIKETAKNGTRKETTRRFTDV